MQGIKHLLPGVRYGTHAVLPDEQRGLSPVSFGDFWFVDSGSGSDTANAGRRPNDAFATIDKCFDTDQVAANNGDIIYVLPGHAENIAAATDLVIDVAGVRIIGLGEGRARPVLTYTNASGTVEFDAASCSLENIVLLASVTAVTVGVNVDANDCAMLGCEMNWDATGDDWVTGIDIDAFDRFTLANCSLIAEDTAGMDEMIRLDDADNITIDNNYIYGDFTDAAIIGEGAAGTSLLATNNYIYNSDTTAGHTFDLNVAFTGLIAYNSIGTLFATAPETAFDPGSCLCLENYVANAVDETGTIIPVTLST